MAPWSGTHSLFVSPTPTGVTCNVIIYQRVQNLKVHNYCVSVWGSIYQSYLNRIIVLQKKVIRIISKVSFDAHTGVLFKNRRF